MATIVIYIFFLYICNSPDFHCIWSNGSEDSCVHLNNMFSGKPCVILTPLTHVTDVYLISNFNYYHSLVVPDTLIFLLLKPNTCFGRWPPGMRIMQSRAPSFQSCRPFVNFTAVHAVIAVLKRHLPANLISFHTV